MRVRIVGMLELRHIQRVLRRHDCSSGIGLPLPLAPLGAARGMGIRCYLVILVMCQAQDGWIRLLFVPVGRLEGYRVVDGHLVAGLGKIKAGELVVRIQGQFLGWRGIIILGITLVGIGLGIGWGIVRGRMIVAGGRRMLR